MTTTKPLGGLSSRTLSTPSRQYILEERQSLPNSEWCNFKLVSIVRSVLPAVTDTLYRLALVIAFSRGSNSCYGRNVRRPLIQMEFRAK